MSVRRSLQLTLALLKPDVTQIPHIVQSIRETILSEGFLIVRRAELQLSHKQAEEFYAEHKQRFFYNRLVTFMSSGPLHALVLLREDSIARWRALMGPTKVFQTRLTHPHTIRGTHGLTDTRNTTHGSDSPETALKEIAFFFPEFDVHKWNREEMEKFQSGSYKFDEDSFLHRPV